MSWRLISVFLLLAAGASAWGGLQLGNWLIAHGPAQIQMPDTEHVALISKTPVLDANGKPFVAAAPQPLADGRQGVPQLAPPVDWQIGSESLLNDNRPIALATTAISMDEAIALAQQQMDEGAQVTGGQAIQPIDVTIPPPPPTTAVPDNPNWQRAFRAELQTCAALGFFSRPSCAWAARNKYCEPHNAWGKVEDCPAKRSSF